MVVLNKVVGVESFYVILITLLDSNLFSFVALISSVLDWFQCAREISAWK